jgi:hypothetical protein
MVEQQVRVGEVWRRKKDGKLVEIDGVRAWYSEFDIAWRGQNFKGRGAIWQYNFLKNYEKVEETNG